MPSLTTLDLQPLFTFYTTATARTFTEAAERLSLSQSAVSHAIRKLERSLGQEFFDRNHTPIRLTDAGLLLYRSCEKVFAEIHSCEDLLLNKRDQPLAGPLRIGATIEFGNSVLSKNVSPFLEKHPEIETEFYFGDDLLKALLNDEVDVIIDCEAHLKPELTRLTLFREKYILISSPKVFKKCGFKKIEDLEKCHWLTIDKSGQWWQRLLKRVPPGTQLSPRKMIPVNHLRGCINLVISGVGIGLVPAYCVQTELRQKRLKVLLPEFQISEDRFFLYFKSFKKNNLKIQAFTNFMQDLDIEELKC